MVRHRSTSVSRFIQFRMNRYGIDRNAFAWERMMALGNQVPDKTLLANVQRKMAQKGGSNRVSATVRSGDATISGSIAYEHERKMILRSVASVPGVRRVIDQLILIVKKKVVQAAPTSSFSASSEANVTDVVKPHPDAA